MVFLDYWRYPIERIKGHWLRNILRILMRTRRIRRGYWNGYGVAKTKETQQGSMELRCPNCLTGHLPENSKHLVLLTITGPPLRQAVVIAHSKTDSLFRANMHEPNTGWLKAAANLITRVRPTLTVRVLAMDGFDKT